MLWLRKQVEEWGWVFYANLKNISTALRVTVIESKNKELAEQGESHCQVSSILEVREESFVTQLSRTSKLQKEKKRTSREDIKEMRKPRSLDC